LLTLVLEVALHIGAAEILPEFRDLFDDLKEFDTLSQFVVLKDCDAIVEEGTDQALLLTRLRGSEVGVDVSNGLEQVLRRLGQAASYVNLYREVAMGEKLELWDVEVFCHLVHLRMQKQEDGRILGDGRKVAARIAVPQQRDGGCPRRGLDAGLETILRTILEGVVQQRAIVEEPKRTDAIRDVADIA
jgi:hypothetical protein